MKTTLILIACFLMLGMASMREEDVLHKDDRFVDGHGHKGKVVKEVYTGGGFMAAGFHHELVIEYDDQPNKTYQLRYDAFTDLKKI